MAERLSGVSAGGFHWGYFLDAAVGFVVEVSVDGVDAGESDEGGEVDGGARVCGVCGGCLAFETSYEH